MGNLFTECQRCSAVIDQCELCSELLPRRGAGQGNGTASSPGSRSTGPGGRAWPEANGVSPGGSSRQDLQPTNMSDAELIALAQQRSLQEMAGPGQGSPRLGEDVRQRLVDGGTDPALLFAAYGANNASLPPGSQGPPAQQLTEEELLAQSILRSKREEEASQRAQLREEQSSEYEESLRIDRERELERQRKEEQKLKDEEDTKAKMQQEEEQRRKEEEEAKAKAEEEQKAKGKLIEEARSRLAEEPLKGDLGCVAVRIRTPEGKALKRSFRSSDLVSQLYDYTIAEGGETLVSQDFRLVTTMPRSVYEIRGISLEVAGLQGQCALLVEIIEPDEPDAAVGQ